MNELPSRITDQEIARLPLSHGRGELLEEIMQTESLTHDHDELSTRRRRGRAWLASGGAAAAVAALAGVVLIPQLGGDEPGREGQPLASSGAAPGNADPARIDVSSVPGGAYFALTTRGWKLDHLRTDQWGSSASWVKGDQQFDYTTYPASRYQDYYDDRNLEATAPQEPAESPGGNPPAPVPPPVEMSVEGPGVSDGPVEETDDRMRRIGETQLLGQSATTWAYSDHDHATMRAPEGGSFVEFRGSGMDPEEYHALLETLVQTDRSGFTQAFDEQVVSDDERLAVVRDKLRGVELPPGFTAADVEAPAAQSDYQFSADVVRSVACAWVDEYDAGDATQRQTALAALDGSTEWKVLQDMADEGDYPEVFWGHRDQPQELYSSIGCDPETEAEY